MSFRKSSGESPPSLRRKSTLPVAEETDVSLAKKKSTLTGRASVRSTASLKKTASITVVEPEMVTTIEGLRSGSSIGITTAIDDTASKTGSMRKSASKASLGKVPSLAKSASKGSVAGLKKVASISKTGDGVVADGITSLRKSLSNAGTSTKIPEPMDMAPSGGLTEIVFSFDTTGSMSRCLKEVRGRMQDIVQRLSGDIPGIRISIFAHGDYCDKDKYIVKWIDFGSTLPELMKFIKSAGPTWGGDGPECYELVLRRVQEVLSWTPGSQRSLVMIGDADPHPVGYTYGDFTNDIDWKTELVALKNMGVRVYSVDCSFGTLPFFKAMADKTGGQHLKLSQFSNIFDLIMTICYKEGGAELLDMYEAEMRARDARMGLHKDMEGILKTLKGKGGTLTTTAPPTVGLFGGTPLWTPGFTGFKAPSPVGLFGGTPLWTGPLTGLKAASKKKTTPKKVPVKRLTKKATKPTKPSGARKITKKAAGGKTKTKAAGSKAKKTKTKTKAKTKKTKKTQKKKQPKKKIVRQYRECVTEANFDIYSPVKSVKWSEWKKAIVPDKPRGAKNWIKCTSWCGGFRNKSLFKDDRRTQSFYEVAVTAPGKIKKHVVYVYASRGFGGTACWDTYLLHVKAVQQEVADVISRGASLFIRRGVVTEPFRKATKGLLKTFDYAWRKRTAGKRNHRSVTKAAFVISNASF